jgi:hypothetical protein
VVGPRRLKSRRLTTRRLAATVPISLWPTPLAVKTSATLLGSVRSAVRLDQSLSTKMCATRHTLAIMRIASEPICSAAAWRSAKAAPSSGDPWSTRTSCRRWQDRYRAAAALAATGMTEVCMFVSQSEPARVDDLFSRS